MKNSQKGFAAPLLVIIIALAVGAGAYFYVVSTKNNEPATVIDGTGAAVCNDISCQRGRDGRRESDLSMLKFQLGFYYQNNRAYPAQLSDITAGDSTKKIPKDPLTGLEYKYETLNNAQDFKLCVSLEATKSEKCVSKI